MMPYGRYLKHLFRNMIFPGDAMTERYQAFSELISHDRRAHEHMADLEAICHQRALRDISAVEKAYALLAEEIRKMIDCLERICPRCIRDLPGFYRKIDAAVKFMLPDQDPNRKPDAGGPFVMELDRIPDDADAHVGGKAANLARAHRHLELPVPPAFVITTGAFRAFLAENDLDGPIGEILSKIDIADLDALHDACGRLRGLIDAARIPEAVGEAVTRGLARLSAFGDAPGPLAFRSSAVGEDGEISFAGIYDSLLDLTAGEWERGYRQVIAGKYTPQAVSYRIQNGLSDPETPMAVLVMRMIDPSAAGVIYTSDPGGPHPWEARIHVVAGRGDALVSGAKTGQIARIDPRRDPPHITVMDPCENRACETASSLLIDLSTIRGLHGWAERLEDFFQTPQDVEWCRDRKGRLFLLQTRPITGVADDSGTDADACHPERPDAAPLIADAEAVARGVAYGKAFVLEALNRTARIPPESILVVKQAAPSLAAVIPRVAAIVSETGSPAGHLASVAREFGVPMLIHPGAAQQLQTGREVTLDADHGAVHAGKVEALLSHPCTRRDPAADSPLSRKLDYIRSFISPLTLVDPDDETFTPQNCRSHHDILRYCHETAIREMFLTTENQRLATRRVKRLKSAIPITIHILDVGGGLEPGADDAGRVSPEEISCKPLADLLEGLLSPGIRWKGFEHYDWAAYDKVAMSGGFAPKNSVAFASYAIVADRYLNLHLKFGYHFVIIDSVCSETADENHILLRFAGGGGDDAGKSRRIAFISGVLSQSGFRIRRRGDLLDADSRAQSEEAMHDTLVTIGRLLGATRLMDMRLKAETDIDAAVDAFLNGRYDFSEMD